MQLARYLPLAPVLVAVMLGVLVAAAVALPGVRVGDPVHSVVLAARVLLAGAVLLVLGFTLTGSAGPATRLNLHPLRTIHAQLASADSLAQANLLGNVALFVPIGLLLPVAAGWGWWRTVVACVALSVAIEATQRVLARSADIDDVLLNTLGGAGGAVLGVLVAAVLRWWGGRGRRPNGPSRDLAQAGNRR